jgi:hypothetical protein
MSKLNKVLVIGLGPIIIGQEYCHSEGVRLRRATEESSMRPFAALRVTEGVRRVTKEVLGVTVGVDDEWEG